MVLLNETVFFVEQTFSMQQSLDLKSFSKAVKKKRTELGIDIRELSKRLGIGIGTISRMENGKQPDISVLLLTCDWLDVSICSFIKTKK